MILAKKWVCVAPYYLMCLFLPFSDIFNPCSLARVSPVCPEFFGAERKGGQHFFVCVFVFCLFFSGPWPPDSLGICSAIICERERERGLILSLHAMLCLSGEKKNKKKKTTTFVRQAGQDNHPSCPPWQGTTPRVAEKWKPPQVFTPRPSV